MAVDPVYNWTGFYIGINGGGIWGGDHSMAVPTDAGTAAFFGFCFASGACPRDYGRTSGSSYEVGGQIGYNWQASNFVYGLEADFQWSDYNKANAVAVSGVPGSAPFAGTSSTRLDWFGTGRGRVGVLVAPSFLLYGTGGVAFGDVRHTFTGGFPGLT